MSWALPLSGLILGGVAVVFSFKVADVIREASSRKNRVDTKLLQGTLRRLWIAVGCAAGAGAIQSFEGDVLIATVWAIFLVVQGLNISTVHEALRRNLG